MLHGAHAPNASFTQADYDILRTGKFRSVKLMHYHTAIEVGGCRAMGVTDFTMRLPDSRRADGNYYNAEDYVALCIPIMRRNYVLGIKWYQVSNEDQFLWVTREFGPWQAQWWYRRVVPMLRAGMPPDVKLISPAMSFAPSLWSHGPQNPTQNTLDDWLAAYMWTSAGTIPSFFSLWDSVGVDSYWQNERQMRDPSFGRNYEVVHQKSGGMRVDVCEWASSAHELVNADGTPKLTPQEVEAIRIAQYPDWLSDADSEGYVRAAHCYLVGGTQDWQGFRVTQAVAHSMAAFKPDLPDLQGQSEWMRDRGEV